MNREELLEKSRMENKGEDLQDREFYKEGATVGIIAAWIFAAILTVIRLFIDGEFPYDMWALAGAVNAAVYTVKAMKQTCWQDILGSVVWWGYTIVFAGQYIYQLLA